MPALPSDVRSAFEKEVISARDIAERAAGVALTTLAVARERPAAPMNEAQRRLRRALRARARQLGGGDMEAGLPRLVEEIAYEQWHRMLFARFLAENHLLMHPEGVAVTLAECAELAPAEGAEDMWDLATRYAGAMLPGIFLVDDPAVNVRFAPEWRHRLERIVTGLPRRAFTADDSLGWAYQFWQSKKKDEINASERKIGGADIAPVTQLFTEDYMVKFLLHNSLGAWWAARHPNSPLVQSFEYLRYREDGTPVAGTFEGWPDRVADVTMMDPCGGSGHFIVAGFEMLYRMRMDEEGLSAEAAGDAVIRDNLFMLELDPRCTQIAAFNLALAAWKASGYRPLPLPNIACSGIPVAGQLDDWLKLARDDYGLQRTIERLYHLFKNAPDLGSLINPVDIPLEARLFVGDYERVKPLLELALTREIEIADPAASLLGITVTGMIRAVRLLSSTYTLVVTNVPYLGRSKQVDELTRYCDQYYPRSKSDLSTVFIERCRDYTAAGGSLAIVAPQNWLFLISYENLREHLLKHLSWNVIVRLGAKGFQTPMWDFNVALFVFTTTKPVNQITAGFDVQMLDTPQEKAKYLRSTTHKLYEIAQETQLNNPDCRITLENISEGTLLSQFAVCLQGISSADYPRFGRYFWEQDAVGEEWGWYQGTVQENVPYGGRERILWIEELRRQAKNLGSAIRGGDAWGKRGVAVSQMGQLPVSLYTGDLYDNNYNEPQKLDHRLRSKS